MKSVLVLCLIAALTVSASCHKETLLGGELWIDKYVVAGVEAFNAVKQSNGSSSGCFSPNFCYVPYDSSKSGPNSNWPSNLADVNGWVGYGAYLIIIFLIPLVALVVLCNVAFYFWCCRKLGHCGDTKPIQNGYPKKPRRILLIPIDIIYGVLILFTILAIIFSALFSGGVTSVLKSTFSSTDSIVSTVNNLQNFILGIPTTVNSTFDQASNVINGISAFNTPLQNINNEVGSAISQLGYLQQDIYNVQNNSNLAVMYFNYLSQIPQLSGVPTSNDLPQNIDNSGAISSAQQQLISTQQSVNSTQAAIVGATTKFQQPLSDARANVNSLVSTVSSTVNGPITQLQQFEQKYFSNDTQSSIKYYTNMGEIIRVVLTCVFISIPMIVYAIFLLVVYPCKKDTKCCFQATACFTFFTAWIPFVIACVSFILWAFLTNTCASAESSVMTLLNSTNISFQNLTLQQIAQNVLKCNGNQDFLSAAGISLNSTLNFNSYSSQLSTTLQNGLNQFNLNNTLINARAGIAQFQNQSGLLAFNFTDQINLAFAKLQNVSAQAVPATFGYNQSDADNAMQAVNNYANPKTGAIFSYSNITSFNTSDPLYAPKATADNLKNSALNYKPKVDLLAAVQYNITQVNNTLININGNYTDAQNIKYTLVTALPNQMNAQLDSIQSLTDQLKGNITQAANSILGVITNSVSTVQSVLGCGVFASNYQQSKTVICQQMIGYMGVTGLSSQFIGLLMFALFPLLLMGTKYHGFKQEWVRPDVTVIYTNSPIMTGDVEMQDESKRHPPLDRDE